MDVKRKDAVAPPVGIGMFLYNEERYVAEAISSLLAQTHADFELVILDDCSTDRTAEIVESFAAKDARIRFYRNERRMGYGTNYLRTFERGRAENVYWAWAAGHDRHAPTWLAAMLDAFGRDPGAVMAYPLTVRISETGERYPDYPSPRFETTGLDAGGRIAALRTGQYRMGDMIYGLFRVDALRAAGVFPQFLLPDVLLLWRLAQVGTFVQVPEELWYRRFVGLFSVKRQRRVMFGRLPWYGRLPWPVVNTVALFASSVLHPPAGRDVASGMRLTAAFFRKYWPYIILSNPTLARLSERPLRFLQKRKDRSLAAAS